MPDHEKPSSIVQDLCKKLKLQLDELAVALEEEPSTVDLDQRRILFKQLQEQLSELSS